MKYIGYSTGAIALGDFGKALKILANQPFNAIELSALRTSEVLPLLEALPIMDLAPYEYVSFHAPSKFNQNEEAWLVNLLYQLPVEWPIVVHPDSICDSSLWRSLGSRVAIENMDKRKPIGRTRYELEFIFEQLPEAQMCFDIGHARQFDASMTEAFLILKAFYQRIVQIHVSEVDTANRHDRVSYAAEIAFRQVASYAPARAALILESRVTEDQIGAEARKAVDIFSPQIVHPDLFWFNVALA